MTDNNCNSTENLQSAISSANNLLDENYNESVQRAKDTDQASTERKCLTTKDLPDIFFRKLEPSYKGGKRTNSEARDLTSILAKWGEDNLPEHDVYSIAKEIEGLFVTVWTEIDEALSGLSMFKRVLQKRAPDVLVARPEDSHFRYEDGTIATGLDTAMLYLHRWQDRGGAIGNVAQGNKAGHPLTELKETKARLTNLLAELEDFSDEASTATESIMNLLWVAQEHLPPESMKAFALISAAIKVVDHLDDHIELKARTVKEYKEESGQIAIAA